MVKKTTAIIAVVVAVLAVTAVAGYALLGNSGNSNQKVIYWTTVAPVNQGAAIANGTISAGVCWEPYVSSIVQSGQGHILITSKQIWDDHPCCVLAVRTAYAQENPDAVAAFIAADIVANQWLVDTIAHPGTANYTLMLNIGAQFSYGAKYTEANIEAVNESLSDTLFETDLTQSDLNWFVNYTQEFQSLNQYSVNITSKGYADAEDYVNHLVNTSYYQMALSVLKSDHIKYNISVGYLTGDLHQFARLIASNATVGGGESIFQQYGISVSSPNTYGYANGGYEMDAFKGGYIDIGYLGSPPVLLKTINAGVDVTIVAMVNGEGSAFVAADGINSFSDLAGKVVGTPGPGSIQHLLLLYYAHELGYTVKSA